jgi:hypothetical protein
VKGARNLYLALYHETMASLSNVLTAASEFKRTEDSVHQQAQGLPLLLEFKRHRDNFGQLIVFAAPETELADSSQRMDTWHGEDMSFLLCKIAFGLITVDTALLACYKSGAIFLFPGLCAQQYLIPSPDFLEIEIERCFQLAQKSFEVAIKVTPLNTRPLIYVFRSVSDRIRSQEEYHSIWDRLRDLTVD